MQMTRSRISLSYIVAIIVVLAFVSISSYLASLNMKKQLDDITGSALPLSDAASNLLTDLLNQETGLRGYLIKGDPIFLEPYQAGLRQLNKDLASIDQLDTDFPAMKTLIETEVKPQIEHIQAYYSDQINLVKQGKIEEAQSRVDFGKLNMDRFRVINDKLHANLSKLMTDASDASNRAGYWSRVITLIGGLMAVVVGVLSAVLFIRANQAEIQLRRSEETYRTMAESLEAQNEEIIMQQEEQERTLIQLSEREQELETISMYQETLTGHIELRDFLQVSVPALLDSLHLDAALVLVELPEQPGQYEVIFAAGYPGSYLRRRLDDLYGPARRVFDERKTITRKRATSESEAGLHDGISAAIDHYIPLFDDKSRPIGILLLTGYGGKGQFEDRERLTRGLTRQFGFAFFTQLMSEERRRQAARLEQLNDQLQEEKLLIEEQRDLIGRILESTYEGMLMLDASGSILFANSRMKQYFHSAGSDLVGQSFLACCREAEPASPGFSAAREIVETLLGGERRPFTERFTFLTADPLEKHVELFATPVGDIGDTGGNGFLLVFRDRTEEERVDEMKNEFISIVSHELRTPLASVLGFVEILLNRELGPDKQKRYMETIYREATRLSNLINDFLDLQRMESGKQLYHIAPVDAAAVVKEVAEQWMGKMSHHIEVDAPNPNVWVMADTDRLRQVLHNLMSNAVKYSPGAERIDIRVFTEGTSAVFEIQDYGLGIPEEAKELLFTKFYRVDNSDRRQIGGTGLGLAIVKEIVEAHRGAISFTSEMGRGTTFRIELLRYEPKRLGGRIVLLEDDDDLARQMQEAFDKLDVQCVQIRSAEEGILLLNRTGEHTPLLVVVDILLEGVKTGWDFLAHLYAQDKLRRVPVIVSSVLEPPNQFKEKEIGRYMSKPFTMDRLVQTAKRLMESASEVSYVFPVQDTSLLTNSLKRSGIEAKEWRAEDDIIFIDIAPPSP